MDVVLISTVEPGPVSTESIAANFSPLAGESSDRLVNESGAHAFAFNIKAILRILGESFQVDHRRTA